MKPEHGFVSAAVTGLVAVALFVVAPGSAGAADACRLGASNTGPRSCATTEFRSPPMLTVGDGICVGILNSAGVAFDGPLYQYSSFPGATHSVELRVTQGFSPLGDYAPTFLACDVTAIVDWHNLDTGQRGTLTRYIPAGSVSSRPVFMQVGTGPGRVQLTLRTDRPSIPVTTEVFVP